MALLGRQHTPFVLTTKNSDGGTTKYAPGPTVSTQQPPPPRPQVITQTARAFADDGRPTALAVVVAQRTPQPVTKPISTATNTADGGAPAVSTVTAPSVVINGKTPMSKPTVFAMGVGAEVGMGTIFIVPALPSLPTRYMTFITNVPTDTTPQPSTTPQPVIVTNRNFPSISKTLYSFNFIGAAEDTPDAKVITSPRERERKYLTKIISPAFVDTSPPPVAPDAPLVCGPTGVFGTDRSSGIAGIVRTTAVAGTDRESNVAGEARTSNTGGTARASADSALTTRSTDTAGTSRTTRIEDPC